PARGGKLWRQLHVASAAEHPGPGRVRSAARSPHPRPLFEGELQVSERTLVLIKPDGVKRGLIGDVIARVERKGLKVVAMDLRTLDTETAKAHYAEHSEKPFFGELVEFITSGPLVAMVVEGHRA